MLTLVERLSPNANVVASFILSLTAEERTRSRYRFETTDRQAFHLYLPRGTVLRDGDLLRADPEGCLVRVVAKPEPVLTVTADTSLDLLRAAYHLGNRHVPLEITATYLRLTPDPILRGMLEQLGLQVMESVQPFQPEAGAYNHSYADQ
jgi:urease accessory protein